MTDQELLEKHDIMRGGSKVTVSGRPKETLVSEREVREANREFLATLEAQEQGDTESDEAEADEADESASDSDTSEKSAESQDRAPDSSSNKELDLRRRRQKARRRASGAQHPVHALLARERACGPAHELHLKGTGQ